MVEKVTGLVTRLVVGLARGLVRVLVTLFTSVTSVSTGVTRVVSSSELPRSSLKVLVTRAVLVLTTELDNVTTFKQQMLASSGSSLPSNVKCQERTQR